MDVDQDGVPVCSRIIVIMYESRQCADRDVDRDRQIRPSCQAETSSSQSDGKAVHTHISLSLSLSVSVCDVLHRGCVLPLGTH